MKAPPFKCPSVQWQPDGLTIRTKKWFPGAGFLGAPPISLTLHRSILAAMLMLIYLTHHMLRHLHVGVLMYIRNAMH